MQRINRLAKEEDIAIGIDFNIIDFPSFVRIADLENTNGQFCFRT